MNAREFTNHDWDAFAGCERWADGAEPLMALGALETGKEVCVVLDRNGACLMIEDDDQNDYGGHVLEMEFPTQAAARAFAIGMGEPKTKDECLRYGFKAI